MKTLRQFISEQPIGHIAHGAFHRWLGKSEDEPITDADIQKGLKAGGHAAKMANFARNARKFHHEEVVHEAIVDDNEDDEGEETEGDNKRTKTNIDREKRRSLSKDQKSQA